MRQEIDAAIAIILKIAIAKVVPSKVDEAPANCDDETYIKDKKSRLCRRRRKKPVPVRRYTAIRPLAPARARSGQLWVATRHETTQVRRQKSAASPSAQDPTRPPQTASRARVFRIHERAKPEVRHKENGGRLGPAAKGKPVRWITGTPTRLSDKRCYRAFGRPAQPSPELR